MWLSVHKLGYTRNNTSLELLWADYNPSLSLLVCQTGRSVWLRTLFPSCVVQRPQGLKQQYCVLSAHHWPLGQLLLRTSILWVRMYISGQEVLLLCFWAQNLCHTQESLYLPCSPMSHTEPSLPDQPGSHHFLLTPPSSRAWIPPLTGALRALSSSQDVGNLPLAFLLKTTALALLFFRTPATTSSMTAIVFYNLRILLCQIIPEPREHQT